MSVKYGLRPSTQISVKPKAYRDLNTIVVIPKVLPGKAREETFNKENLGQTAHNEYRDLSNYRPMSI